MALLLIGVGLALLLNNLGIITVDWSSVWRFWPLLLILVGLEVMLGHRSFLGSLSIVLLGVALVFGVIFFTTIRDGIPGTFAELIGIDPGNRPGSRRGQYDHHFLRRGAPAVQASYTRVRASSSSSTHARNVGYLTTLSQMRLHDWLGDLT
jgi:hypothetical protein